MPIGSDKDKMVGYQIETGSMPGVCVCGGRHSLYKGVRGCAASKGYVFTSSSGIY